MEGTRRSKQAVLRLVYIPFVKKEIPVVSYKRPARRATPTGLCLVVFYGEAEAQITACIRITAEDQDQGLDELRLN